jgi:hypothetical protein
MNRAWELEDLDQAYRLSSDIRNWPMGDMRN